MKLILLGTGTSTGVPEVGCACYICKSANPRDKRLRTSALLLTSRGKRILIDCGPDFRQQALHIGLGRIDAIVLTHEHYDHVYGLDDLRTIAWRELLPIYGQERVLDAVRQRMHYVFSPTPYPGTPQLDLRVLGQDEVLTIDGLEIRPIVVNHGKLPIYGYRFHEEGRDKSQDIVYITDMKSITPEEWLKVEGCRLLVINALRYLREHPSHQNVLDVQHYLGELAVRPQTTVLTHLSHHAPDYTRLGTLLPEGILVGYDYMCLDLKGESLKAFPFEQGQEPYSLQTSVVANREEWQALLVKQYDMLVCSSDEAEHRSANSVVMASTPQGGELALSIKLSRTCYPDQEEELRLAIREVIFAVLRFHQVAPEDYDSIYVLRQEDSTDGFYHYAIHIRVNDVALGLLPEHVAQDALSLRAALNRGVDVDIIVVESLITAQLSKTLGEMMPSFIDSLA